MRDNLKRAIVTGASGFVGTAVLQALISAGVAVTAISRYSARRTDAAIWRQADLTDRTTLLDFCRDADTIFHVAGHAHAWMEKDDDGIHRQVTVEGTGNLLHAAAEAGVKRFIFFSSVKAGGEGGAWASDGTFSDNPTTTYGRTKREAEELVIEAGRKYGMHICNLRLSMVYGIGMKGNLPRMIEAIARGRFPPLPETDNKRSMVWLMDVVQAALLAAEKPEANGRTYIVTDGEIYSTHRICAAIYAALGKPMPRWTIPIAVLTTAAKVGDAIGSLRGRRFIFDSEALEKLTDSAHYSSANIVRELGFRPTKKLEDVLPEIVGDYRARGIIHR